MINIIKNTKKTGRDDRGITLVELIVTMGIMVLVIIMIYSFFLLSNSLSKINSDKADAQAQTRLIYQGLQKEIETAQSITIGNRSPSEIIADAGYDGFDVFYLDGKVLKKMDADGTVSIPFGSTPLNFLAVAYEAIPSADGVVVKVMIRANEEETEYQVNAPNISSIVELDSVPRYVLIIKSAE